MENEMDNHAVLFEQHAIRRMYDSESDTWWFSVVDIVYVLTASPNPRDYWFRMKVRLKQEDGSELSTLCRQLKMQATDGKMRLTDVATAEGLLRIIQSIPSPIQSFDAVADFVGGIFRFPVKPLEVCRV